MNTKISKGAVMYNKILIIRLSSIGDVINSMPVARALKNEYKDAKISWLVSPPCDEALRLCPDIDEIIVWDRRPFDIAVKNRNIMLAYKLLYQATSALSKREFDVVLDIHSLFLTGILSKFAKCKKRFGIDELHECNSLFMSKIVENIEEIHKAKRYFSVLKLLNIDREITKSNIEFDKNLVKNAGKFLKKNGVDLSKKIIAVNLKTTWENKHYPFELFVEIIKKIDPNIEIIYTGIKGDIPIIEKVRNATKRGIVTAGETSVTDLFYIFKRIDLLLTVDSGPLHIASLADLKTISLWGPTEPRMYAPLFGKNSFIISDFHCVGCNKRKCKLGDNLCMREIKPEVVLKEINEVLV